MGLGLRSYKRSAFYFRVLEFRDVESLGGVLEFGF